MVFLGACAHCWSVSDHTGNTGTPLSVGQAPTFNVSITSCSPAIRLSKHSGTPLFLGELPLYTLLSLSEITVVDKKHQLSENGLWKHKQPSLRIHPDCCDVKSLHRHHLGARPYCTKSTWIIQLKRPLNTLLYTSIFTGLATIVKYSTSLERV